jgi:DNA-binding GntR family transcriptional regulator
MLARDSSSSNAAPSSEWPFFEELEGKQRSPTTAPSLVERAYEEIKDGILSSRLVAGQLLKGPDLAVLFDMSRTPVREALSLLAKEGLVTSLPRTGYLVSSVTVEDVKEIFELRLHLEGVAAELVATRATASELDGFERVDIEVRELVRDLAPDDPRTVRLAIATNRRFHLTVASLARNGRLYETIRRLLDEGERIQALDPNLRMVGFLVGAHIEVLDALRRGEPARARKAMQSHMRHTQARILDLIQPRTGE